MDYGTVGQLVMDHVLSHEELAQFPAGTQAHPEQEADGSWSHTRYRLEWGHPIIPYLSFSCLGHHGGFGNQLFQYAFARIFGAMLGRAVLVPPWAGSKLFGLKDPPPVQAYGHYRDLSTSWEESELRKNLADTPALLDIAGYFQFPTAFYAPYRDQIRKWFTPVPQIGEVFGPALANITEGGERTLVTVQIRRRGYGKGMFFIAPNETYVDWLWELWPKLKNPVLYVASDEIDAVLPAFAPFSPKSAYDFKGNIQGMEFFTDFWVMMQSQCLAISNSTFGMMAAMLNQSGNWVSKKPGTDTFAWSKAWRPRYSRPALVPFNPWNSEVLTDRDRAMAEDEPQLSKPHQVFGEEIVNG